MTQTAVENHLWACADLKVNLRAIRVVFHIGNHAVAHISFPYSLGSESGVPFSQLTCRNPRAATSQGKGNGRYRGNESSSTGTRGAMKLALGVNTARQGAQRADQARIRKAPDLQKEGDGPIALLPSWKEWKRGEAIRCMWWLWRAYDLRGAKPAACS